MVRWKALLLSHGRSQFSKKTTSKDENIKLIIKYIKYFVFDQIENLQNAKTRKLNSNNQEARTIFFNDFDGFN